MTSTDARLITLHEYESLQLDSDHLSPEDGRLLWERWGRARKRAGKRVAVEFPSPATDGKWVLTPQGWVGHLPLRPGLSLALQPKVPIGNLFRMLEVAYSLKSFEFLEGVTELDTIEEFYERLANKLASRVLLRARRGFYREYVGRQGDLSSLRGRLDLARIAARPVTISLPCLYREHTSDIEDNQILSWTMQCIARSGLCTDRSRNRVRRAYHGASGAARPLPIRASACVGRTYNRLNEDYRTLHALCRFFLEAAGPTQDTGGRGMLPFLMNMAILFELFVAEWLRENLPPEWVVSAQHRHPITKSGEVKWIADLVLIDRHTHQASCVIDTKYKKKALPSPADVAQVVAYAVAMNCKEAILIYPTREIKPMVAMVGNIRVRTMAFDLAGDFANSGRALVRGIVDV